MTLIRNLVQEFNGLVSKGSAEMLAFLLSGKSCFDRIFFLFISLDFYQKLTQEFSFILSAYNKIIPANFPFFLPGISNLN